LPATTCSTAESVTVTAIVPDTTVTFSGYAPAGAVIYFKENAFIIGTAVSNSIGLFSKLLQVHLVTHTYLVYLTDTTGLNTPEVALNPITLMTQADTPVANIHLPLLSPPQKPKSRRVVLFQFLDKLLLVKLLTCMLSVRKDFRRWLVAAATDNLISVLQTYLIKQTSML